jgi:transcriptional regulator with XRE-family HTH domain
MLMARTLNRGLLIPRLAEWRNRRALTQGELAEQAKVSRDTVYRAERGGKVSAPNVRRLAAALEVKVDELMEGSRS